MNRTGKRIVAMLLLAVLLLPTLAACKNKENPLIGTWKATRGNSTAVYTFQEDGKLVTKITNKGETTNLTYSYTIDGDTVKFGGNTVKFKVDGDKLTMDGGGGVFTFYKVK